MERDSELAECFLSMLGADFERDYWERAPLLALRTELPPALRKLFNAEDLPKLSATLAGMGVSPQVMRNGESCRPREICWDLLEGGSIILNKVDTFWPPIGRLCASLRERFLHVFAVMYISPRNTRAVPAHSDDQDVFVLQLAGSKAWSVYGAPVELPYSHEQVGKQELLDDAGVRELAGPPLITAELTPGSLLYMPRGFVHEARATTAGMSAHITLTVQTSDLNWMTFVRDGLHALHKERVAARMPLALDPQLGGYGAVVAGAYERAGGANGDTTNGGVALGSRMTEEESRAVASGVAVGGSGGRGVTMGAAAHGAREADVSDGGDSGGGTDADAQTVEAAFAAYHELTDATSQDAERAFELGMLSLRRKLASLNESQDRWISRLETVAQGRAGALPAMLRCVDGAHLSMAVGQRRPRGAPVLLQCVLKEQGHQIPFNAGLSAALEVIVAVGKRGAAFAPSDLPEADAYEQVSLCARLLRLGLVCSTE